MYRGLIFHCVATPGTLTANDWSNEIHPKRAGFGKIAEKYRPILHRLFPTGF
jgi:hypothetical protein